MLLQLSIVHVRETPQETQCYLRASYLKPVEHKSHTKSRLFSDYRANRFTFLLVLRLHLQLGHVLLWFCHCERHLAQHNWVQSVHSLGSSTTSRQIMQVKYSSKLLAACSALNCFYAVSFCAMSTCFSALIYSGSAMKTR